jgi:hypothetical protein
MNSSRREFSGSFGLIATGAQCAEAPIGLGRADMNPQAWCLPQLRGDGVPGEAESAPIGRGTSRSATVERRRDLQWPIDETLSQ